MTTLTTANVREQSTEALEVYALDRRLPTEVTDEIETVLTERQDKKDAKRLAALLDDFADHVGTKHAGTLAFGEGVNARVITEDDLERIAELLDPENDQ